MALETLELDAAGSAVDGTNPGSALVIMSAASNYYVTAFNSPAPNPKPLWASNIDTDGARRADPSTYENRPVSLTIETRDTASLNTHLDALTGKVGKIHREGGTLKWTRKDGSVRIFDLLASDSYSLNIDVQYENGRAVVTVQFTALPGLRGAEVDLGDNVETTLPCLVFTEASIPGDLLALGRLMIDNDDATNDQQWLVWGIQSRYYDAASSAALFYEAEGRTAMGGSAIAAGPSGASGAGSNVMRNTALTTSYQAILSTQATGGGAHLSHIGTFRVFARVQIPTANTGTATVALEWGEGDFRRFQQNPQVDLPTTWEGTWRILDLGLIAVSKVTAGTQRWEGRVLAKSTVAGDDIDVDWLMLVPVDEGSGVVTAVDRLSTPTAFSARDEFDQTAGALTGKVAPIGGTWGGAGDADDFTVTGSPNFNVTRAALSDAAGLNNGRFGTLGSTNYTNIVVRANATMGTDGATRKYVGLLARYTNTSNWLIGTVDWQQTSPTTVFSIIKNVAGTITVVRETTSGPQLPEVGDTGSTSWSMTLRVDATGRARFYMWTSGGEPGVPIVDVYDPVLATGGTLQTGLIGLFHHNASAVNFSPRWDNFTAAVPVTDAAIFASQSLEVRSDRVRREDSGGTLWVEPSAYVGDYLRVPPSGAEARTIRCIVKASRFASGDGPDSGIDDISARLFVTPRYLT